MKSAYSLDLASLKVEHVWPVQPLEYLMKLLLISLLSESRGWSLAIFKEICLSLSLLRFQVVLVRPYSL